jgi:hypothetical protein
MRDLDSIPSLGLTQIAMESFGAANRLPAPCIRIRAIASLIHDPSIASRPIKLHAIATNFAVIHMELQGCERSSSSMCTYAWGNYIKSVHRSVNCPNE